MPEVRVENSLSMVTEFSSALEIYTSIENMLQSVDTAEDLEVMTLVT